MFLKSVLIHHKNNKQKQKNENIECFIVSDSWHLLFSPAAVKSSIVFNEVKFFPDKKNSGSYR